MPLDRNVLDFMSTIPRDKEKEEEEARSKKRLLSFGKEAAKYKTSEEQKMLQFARKRLKKAWFPNLKATAVGLGAGVVSPIARLTGQEETADLINRFSNAFQQVATERDVEGIVPPIIKRGARGVGQTLPIMVVAGAAAGPYGAIGAAAGQEANRAVTAGKDAGLKGKELASYVAAKGVIEGGVASVFQKVGLGGAEKIAGGREAVSVGVTSALKKLGIVAITEELPEELITELGHNVADAVSGVDPKAMSVESLSRTAADTTVQTLMTMGAIGAPGVIQSKKQTSIRAEVTQYAKEGKVPTRSKWKSWGLPVEEGKSREQRKETTGRLAESFQTEGQQRVQQSLAEIEAEIEAMPEPGQQQARPAGYAGAVAEAQARGTPELQAPPVAPATSVEAELAMPSPASPGQQAVTEGATDIDFQEREARKLVDDAIGEGVAIPHRIEGELQEGPAVLEAERVAEESQIKRKGFLREEIGARPIDEKLGGPARPDVIGDSVLRGAAGGEVDLSTGDPETDRRTSVKPGPGKLSVRERVGNALKRTWHSVTRAQVHLPKEEEYVFAQETFRLLKVVPQMSVDAAIRTVVAVTHQMGPKQMRLFEKSLLVDNQLRSLKKDQGLRNGWKSEEQVEGYKRKIDALVETTPVVKAALEMRARIVKETVARLVQQGLLSEAVLEDTQGYFHQQVTAIQEAKRKTTGRASGLLKKKKSFQKARVEGRDLSDEVFDFNPSYIESESEWLADAFSELRKKQLLDGLIERYDLTEDANEAAEAAGITLEEYVRTLEDVDFFYPKPGNIFYRAFGISEKIGEALQQEIIESVNLTKAQVRQVMAVGGKHRGVIFPTELVAQLEATEAKHDSQWLAELHDSAIGAWKAYTLLNPKRIIGYNIRNFTGDLDAVLAGEPRILKRMPEAVRELIRYHFGGVGLSPKMRLARNLGVVGAGFFGSEVTESSEMQIFRRLKPEEQRKLLRNPARLYMEVVRPSVEMRENILRYAAFLEYYSQIELGTFSHFGAAKQMNVRVLANEMGADVAAAHMSRELLGDYGNLTEAGEFLRRKLIPFWAFQEINLKRYPRLAINAIQSGQGRGRTAAVISAAATLRIGAMYGALWSWNNIFAPLLFGTDDEDELNPYDKANPHVNLGRNPDGTVRIFRNVGALGDFLEWFGINELLSSVDELQAEQIGVGEVAWEMTKAPIEKVIGSLRPDLKAGYEVTTGQSLFPSPFSPRSTERGVAVANVFGLSDECKWMQGLAVGEGNRARKNYWQRWFIGVTDPRQAALIEMYDARRRFLKMKGVSEGGVYPVSEYKQARDAAANEDYDAFVEWKNVFVAKHKHNSWERFKAFQGRLDPIASRLNDEDEHEFKYEYLTPDQRRKQRMVEDYAAELRARLILWWFASEQKQPVK